MLDWKNPVPQMGTVVHRIPNFSVYRQTTDHTCGPCAVRMTMLSLGLDVPEKEIAAMSLSLPSGTIHWPLLFGYRHFLKEIGFTAELSQDSPDVYERILQDVCADRPVVFIYAVTDDFHPPQKVLHYGVVIGIDEPAGKIYVANPFGMIEEMAVSEWWERFSLLPEYLTPFQQSWLMLGFLKPRSAFFVSER